MSASRVPKKRRRWVRWVVLAVAVIVRRLDRHLRCSRAVSTATTLHHRHRDAHHAAGDRERERQRGRLRRHRGAARHHGHGERPVGEARPDREGRSAAVQDHNPSLDQRCEQAESQLPTRPKQSASQAEVQLLQAKNTLYNDENSPEPHRLDARRVTQQWKNKITIDQQQLDVAELGLTSANESVDSADTAAVAGAGQRRQAHRHRAGRRRHHRSSTPRTGSRSTRQRVQQLRHLRGLRERLVQQRRRDLGPLHAQGRGRRSTKSTSST